MSGATAQPEGITDPPLDDLLQQVDSRYALVLWGSKRARQINAYYAQVGEGLLEYVGPVVETEVAEKPLSIALREIAAGRLVREETDDPGDQALYGSILPEVSDAYGYDDGWGGAAYAPEG